MMPIAPTQWSRAPWKDTMPVARLGRPPRRRRQRPAGVIELVLELGLTRDAADRRVAGVALDGLGGHGAAALELARGAPLIPASVSRLARMISCGRGPAPSRLLP